MADGIVALEESNRRRCRGGPVRGYLVEAERRVIRRAQAHVSGAGVGRRTTASNRVRLRIGVACHQRHHGGFCTGRPGTRESPGSIPRAQSRPWPRRTPIPPGSTISNATSTRGRACRRPGTSTSSASTISPPTCGGRGINELHSSSPRCVPSCRFSCRVMRRTSPHSTCMPSRLTPSTRNPLSWALFSPRTTRRLEHHAQQGAVHQRAGQPRSHRSGQGPSSA
jgi:hypothetical protein